MFAPIYFSPQYLRELIDLYVRFKKIEIGIDLIQRHHQQQGILTQPQLLAAESVNSARDSVRAVIQSLDEYYDRLNANGWELNDFPAVDESVIPEDLQDYGNSRRILHHYVILKQFLDHLNFSNDVIARFNNLALEMDPAAMAPTPAAELEEIAQTG